uniref:Protein kinase domain-containing protein n=1 Tax=Chromera velia CCMP2878 TaxID=1169474 RepID=A0A0K6S6W1_9ALVE|eukprot:Cvel_18046.t2-p1 / transcript=Cvel_18046.t2 / gene=Cvel_18046 / organism=Chromera_velia_CCMP2878 / gene_product=Serine/threonine-protein kinase AFC1, putative / transcript_product=Serine/threonine-protein kinase AFC1, putative / location=Cvel_scaffold1474:1868-6959(-) / protein_length=948 / sequence_SO=supercontig / SO=protein_coding / is_pseudo=false
MFRKLKGETIGGCLLADVIAEGGWGCVYEATRVSESGQKQRTAGGRKEKERLAVKVFRPRFPLLDFQGEVEMLNRVKNLGGAEVEGEEREAKTKQRGKVVRLDAGGSGKKRKGLKTGSSSLQERQSGGEDRVLKSEATGQSLGGEKDRCVRFQSSFISRTQTGKGPFRCIVMELLGPCLASVLERRAKAAAVQARALQRKRSKGTGGNSGRERKRGREGGKQEKSETGTKTSSHYKRGFSLDAVRDAGLQLLDALRLLHAQNVAHTDLKPANIALSCVKDSARFVDESAGTEPEGSSPPKPLKIKLLDFGNAILIKPGFEGSGLISTRPYRCPEVLAAGARGVEPTWNLPADLWSAGCVLFELAAGRELVPFWSDDDSAHLALLKEVTKVPSSTDSATPSRRGRESASCSRRGGGLGVGVFDDVPFRIFRLHEEKERVEADLKCLKERLHELHQQSSPPPARPLQITSATSATPSLSVSFPGPRSCSPSAKKGMGTEGDDLELTEVEIVCDVGTDAICIDSDSDSEPEECDKAKQVREKAKEETPNSNSASASSSLWNALSFFPLPIPPAISGLVGTVTQKMNFWAAAGGDVKETEKDFVERKVEGQQGISCIANSKSHSQSQSTAAQSCLSSSSSSLASSDAEGRTKKQQQKGGEGSRTPRRRNRETWSSLSPSSAVVSPDPVSVSRTKQNPPIHLPLSAASLHPHYPCTLRGKKRQRAEEHESLGKCPPPLQQKKGEDGREKERVVRRRQNPPVSSSSSSSTDPPTRSPPFRLFVNPKFEPPLSCLRALTHLPSERETSSKPQKSENTNTSSQKPKHSSPFSDSSPGPLFLLPIDGSRRRGAGGTGAMDGGRGGAEGVRKNGCGSVLAGRLSGAAAEVSPVESKLQVVRQAWRSWRELRFLELLLALLQMKPSSRPTASEAMQFPFFKEPKEDLEGLQKLLWDGYE